ncbi:hypothetical protein HN587_07575 [Candidatus Woesearchaeota archaeon]|jgi:hypothetical protein|nr:hypothetical protein [Candidatus Woesearchaeota archaeon]
MWDYKQIPEVLRDKIPKRTNDISLAMLHEMTNFMYSDSVEKNPDGTVKDHRLNKDQAKELSGKLMPIIQTEVMAALTKGNYGGSEGDYDSAMVEQVAGMLTGLNESVVLKNLENQELTPDLMTGLAKAPGSNWGKNDKQMYETALDHAIQDDDRKTELGSFVNEQLGQFGVKANMDRYLSGSEVMSGLEAAAKGIGDPEKYVAAAPEVYSLN